VAAAGLVLAGGGLIWTAIPASADTGDITGTGGPASAVGDVTPAGVPVAGLAKSATGATKVLPGGQSGPGY
jgi:hypothetical protein